MLVENQKCTEIIDKSCIFFPLISLIWTWEQQLISPFESQMSWPKWLRYLCAANIEKELLVSDLKLLSFPILKIFCSHEVASYQQCWLLVTWVR